MQFVCPSIYGFCLPLWYLQTLLVLCLDSQSRFNPYKCTDGLKSRYNDDQSEYEMFLLRIDISIFNV